METEMQVVFHGINVGAIILVTIDCYSPAGIISQEILNSQDTAGQVFASMRADSDFSKGQTCLQMNLFLSLSLYCSNYNAPEYMRITFIHIRTRYQKQRIAMKMIMYIW